MCSQHQKPEALTVNPLTGLPNQRQLQQILGTQENEQLLMVEVENSDHIASLFSVSAMDNLILKMASRLQNLDVSGMEYCDWYQLSDHKFAMLTTHFFSETQTRLIISSIYNCLTKTPIYIDDQQRVSLVVRMGAVRNQPEPLMLASMALLHAKQHNQALTIYEPHLNLPHYFRTYLDTFNQLNDALTHDRLKPYFQPIINAKTGAIIKYEALARLLDREGNVIGSPYEFMPVAYKSRLCHKLTRLMIQRVIEAVTGRPHIVSINLSVKDVFDDETRNSIIHTIRKSKLGRQMEFELLEQQRITNHQLAAAYITQLRSCVNQIGIGDFDKRYSNFDRLFMLPLDFVKMDGGIITTIQKDGDARKIFEAVIHFVHQKGIEIIAEQCSNQNICDVVAQLGVHAMQGFHIGAPAEQFVKNIRKVI